MMKSTQKYAIVRFLLINTCLSFMLGWVTPYLSRHFSGPLHVGHGSPIVHNKTSITREYTISRGIKEYHSQYLAFPGPILLAALSDKAKLFEKSVGYFDSTTSKGLAEGLRNA